MALRKMPEISESTTGKRNGSICNRPASRWSPRRALPNVSKTAQYRSNFGSGQPSCVAYLNVPAERFAQSKPTFSNAAAARSVMRSSVSAVCLKQQPRRLSSPRSPFASTGKPSVRFPHPFSLQNRPRARTTAERTPEAKPINAPGREASGLEGGTFSNGTAASSGGNLLEEEEEEELESEGSSPIQSNAGMAGTTTLPYSSPREARGLPRAKMTARPSSAGVMFHFAGASMLEPSTGARTTRFVLK
mmetsp:Transcript_39219/g.83515  ORF Transcript_39219/g.83515 Transcript_39219/m.83515 type:complete len:247 (-) Transcript_39219:478-1218(-)